MTAKIDEWVQGNQHMLYTILDQMKMPKFAAPLPQLKKLFKMFKNPEDYADDEENDGEGVSEELKEEIKKQEESRESEGDIEKTETKDEL